MQKPNSLLTTHLGRQFTYVVTTYIDDVEQFCFFIRSTMARIIVEGRRAVCGCLIGRTFVFRKAPCFHSRDVLQWPYTVCPSYTILLVVHHTLDEFCDPTWIFRKKDTPIFQNARSSSIVASLLGKRSTSFSPVCPHLSARSHRLLLHNSADPRCCQSTSSTTVFV